MKISPSLSSLARVGVVGVCLGTAALTAWAQSSSSQQNTTANPRAQERASDRAQERASDRSALNRGTSTTAEMSRKDRRFVEKFTELSQREMALAQLGAERATNPELKSYAQRVLREHASMHTDFMTVAAGGTLSTDSGSLAGATSESQASMAQGSTSARDRERSDADARRTTDRSTATAPARDDMGRNVSDPDRTTSATASSGSLGAPSSAMATTSATGGKQDRHVRNLMEKKQGKDFDEAFVKRMVKDHDEGVEMLEDLVKDDDRNPQLRAFANKHLPIMREHLSQAKRLEDAID